MYKKVNAEEGTNRCFTQRTKVIKQLGIATAIPPTREIDKNTLLSSVLW